MLKRYIKSFATGLFKGFLTAMLGISLAVLSYIIADTVVNGFPNREPKTCTDFTKEQYVKGVVPVVCIEQYKQIKYLFGNN